MAVAAVVVVVIIIIIIMDHPTTTKKSIGIVMIHIQFWVYPERNQITISMKRN